MSVYSLKVIKGPDSGAVLTISEPKIYLIGRTRQADFQLSTADPFISRRHFLVEFTGRECICKNLSLKNPIQINGIVRSKIALKDGDIIEVGYTHIRFHKDTSNDISEIRLRNCK
ncbi:FHA domain-containing protein [bacterium]|nr:FHA domain-containing protein [candidate division CSSED10-310 bacterium]